MGLLKFLHLYVSMVMIIVQLAESSVFISFDRAPPARTKLSTGVFRYSVTDQGGLNPCRDHGCSKYCEIDGQPLKSCNVGFITLKNLPVNQDHYFLLNVTTSVGERNSSVYKWFIDTTPPTATIVSDTNFTNAANITIDITFSEACNGRGGFKCANSTSCDIIVHGPASIDASTLHMVEPDIKFRLAIDLSMSSMYGRVVIKMADKFCTDQAGNLFTLTNGSIAVVHFDRRPVRADLWTSVPSYQLQISGELRTVIATNKIEELKIFLEFNDLVLNSTKEILSVLNVSAGKLVPFHSRSHGSRRFSFQLQNLSRTQIITVKLQSASLIGRSGTAVSHVMSTTFLYDSTKPAVRLHTRSRGLTKESNINVIIEFTKPVFGFDASGIEVGGGRLERQNVVSVIVPEGKANDVAGNLNLASNQLELRHYSVPAISIALHSFVTAGLLATSLAAALLSLSSANLVAIGALTSGAPNIAISDPSRNLLGMVGHLQVFVFSDWFSVSLPTEYSETTKGLRWLIPRKKLPWKKESTSLWPHEPSPLEGHDKLLMKYIGFSGRFFTDGERVQHSNMSNSNRNSSSLQLWTTKLRTSPRLPCKSRSIQWNISMRGTHYGPTLSPDEYFIYFLRGEPFSASNVIKSMENYTGWQDFEMNLFWLGVAGGGLLAMHLLILFFLRWRTGSRVHGALSIPRFELFLLILMLPCISQSSAFVIRGGTTGGIVAGALLLAVPAAIILSVCLFLIVAIFMGSFVQYREVKNTEETNDPWRSKLLSFFTGRHTIGKWFYLEGQQPSSFLARFGILFENCKGPPMYVLVERSDPGNILKWIDSGQSGGIGRMRAVNSDSGNSRDSITVPTSKMLLGCARSAYLLFDIFRRIGLGIISGAFSPANSSHGQIQCILAFGITLVQLLYLFILKPYIRRGVQVAESVSLLCEATVFGFAFYIDYLNTIEDQRRIGIAMLTLLFISFVCQLVNEWYALIKSLLKLQQPSKPSFKMGLKWVAKGLILPFLPRNYWCKLVQASIQPNTGRVPDVSLIPNTEFETRESEEVSRTDPLNAITATVVPVCSPESRGITSNQITGSTQTTKTIVEGKRPRGLKPDSNNGLKKLRELAKASFLGAALGDEGSTSYAQREHYELSSGDSTDSTIKNRN